MTQLRNYYLSKQPKGINYKKNSPLFPQNLLTWLTRHFVMQRQRLECSVRGSWRWMLWIYSEITLTGLRITKAADRRNIRSSRSNRESYKVAPDNEGGFTVCCCRAASRDLINPDWVTYAGRSDVESHKTPFSLLMVHPTVLMHLAPCLG